MGPFLAVAIAIALFLATFFSREVAIFFLILFGCATSCWINLTSDEPE